MKVDTEVEVEAACETFKKWFYADESIYLHKLLEKLKTSTAPNIRHKLSGTIVREVQKDVDLMNYSKGIIDKFRAGEVDPAWHRFTDYPTMKVYYKREEGKNLFTFYAEKLINASAKNVMTVIAEA